MNIPEKVKRIILDNFSDVNYPISSVLKMVNKEYDMTIEELYAFLEEYEEQTGEVLTRTSKKVSQNVKDVIFEQRLQGKAYHKIAKLLREMGITISAGKVRRVCQRVFEEKGLEEPDSSRKDSYKMLVFVKDSTLTELKNKGMSDGEIKDYFKEYGIDINKPKKYNEEDKYGIYAVSNNYIYDYIYNSKKEGKSYRTIVTELYEKGLETSYESIRKHCKKIFDNKNEKIPLPIPINEGLKVIELKKEPYYSEIYNLRKQGLTYQQIADELSSKFGIKISYETIRTKCKWIFDDKNEKDDRKAFMYDINQNQVNKDIYELRKKGLTFKQIADELNKKGNDFKSWTVAQRCKNIFEMNDEASKYSFKRGRRLEMDPLDKMIYNLRINRYSDGRILEFLNKKGIDISRTNVIHKTKKVFKIKNEEVPKSLFRKSFKRKVNTNISNKQIIDAAYKVAEKKNANKEQLERFMTEVSKMYNLKMDVEINEKER